VNAVLVLIAGTVATFLRRRPTAMRWQRRISGSLLAAIGVRLAIDVPARARI
jgi:threonine/homoserine/homoserine lactone efflux protein